MGCEMSARAAPPIDGRVLVGAHRSVGFDPGDEAGKARIRAFTGAVSPDDLGGLLLGRCRTGIVRRQPQQVATGLFAIRVQPQQRQACPRQRTDRVIETDL